MRLLLLFLFITVRLWAASAPDFTIVALPDTQKYAKQRPDLFRSQVDWILANRTNLNIVYVTHLGDITDDGDEKPGQWTVATNGLYRLLEAGIPLGVVAGNHDHKGGTKYFDKLLGPDLFAGRPWYGGHLGTDGRNRYDLFSVGHLDFIVLHLDFNHDKLDYRAADAWAPGILASNANRRAILVTHDLLSVKGEFDPRGKAIYENLKSHTNLFLMLGGHNHSEAQRADTFKGHTIYSVLSDYQSWTNGGNGYLRLYRFSPARNLIHVQSYSPAINHYRTGPTGEFDIPYRMDPDAPMPDLPHFENRFTILNINAEPKPMSPPATKPAPPKTGNAIVPPGATWRYLDTGSDPGSTWVSPSFDDAQWSTGPAPLGYGDAQLTTTTGYGPDPEQKPITTWFRHTFVVTNPSPDALYLRVLRDDGIAVYLNGTGIYTNNLPGTFAADTCAVKAIGGADESTWQTATIPARCLRPGSNTIAVEVHQAKPDSSDLRFDLEMGSVD